MIGRRKLFGVDFTLGKDSSRDLNIAFDNTIASEFSPVQYFISVDIQKEFIEKRKS